MLGIIVFFIISVKGISPLFLTLLSNAKSRNLLLQYSSLDLKIIFWACEDSNSFWLSVVHTQVVKTKLVRSERGAVLSRGLERGLTILICIAISICSWELWDQELRGLTRAGSSSQKWFVVDGMMACQPGRSLPLLQSTIPLKLESKWNTGQPPFHY